MTKRLLQTPPHNDRRTLLMVADLLHRKLISLNPKLETPSVDTKSSHNSFVLTLSYLDETVFAFSVSKSTKQGTPFHYTLSAANKENRDSLQLIQFFHEEMHQKLGTKMPQELEIHNDKMSFVFSEDRKNCFHFEQYPAQTQTQGQIGAYYSPDFLNAGILYRIGDGRAQQVSRSDGYILQQDSHPHPMQLLSRYALSISAEHVSQLPPEVVLQLVIAELVATNRSSSSIWCSSVRESSLITHLKGELASRDERPDNLVKCILSAPSWLQCVNTKNTRDLTPHINRTHPDELLALVQLMGLLASKVPEKIMRSLGRLSDFLFLMQQAVSTQKDQALFIRLTNELFNTITATRNAAGIAIQTFEKRYEMAHEAVRERMLDRIEDTGGIRLHGMVAGRTRDAEALPSNLGLDEIKTAFEILYTPLSRLKKQHSYRLLCCAPKVPLPQQTKFDQFISLLRGQSKVLVTSINLLVKEMQNFFHRHQTHSTELISKVHHQLGVLLSLYSQPDFDTTLLNETILQNIQNLFPEHNACREHTVQPERQQLTPSQALFSNAKSENQIKKIRNLLHLVNSFTEQLRTIEAKYD